MFEKNVYRERVSGIKCLINAISISFIIACNYATIYTGACSTEYEVCIYLSIMIGCEFPFSRNYLVAAVSAAVPENTAPPIGIDPPPLVIKLMEIRLDAFMRFYLMCARASLKH